MKNKILLTVSFLTAIVMLSSCLKDDIGENWTDDLKGKMYAEVWNGGFAAKGLKPVATPDTFRFLVNIASDQPPSTDVTLTLAVNAEAMTRYNTAKGTNYKLFPNIQILNPTVTIEAGTRNAYVYVKVWNAHLLDVCDNFMAPISITEATGGVIVADALNQGSRLMALPISNPYEGQYQVDGFFAHPTAGTRTIDEVKTFSTVDCRTVHTTIGDLGGYDLYLTINPDYTVTIGGGLSASQPNIPVTGLPNVYDLATRTFTLNYQYTGSGGFRVIHEVCVKL
jgi:hypothetical protein